MKQNMYSLLLIFLPWLFPDSLWAQENDATSTFNIGADIYSRYVWRGLDYGSAPSIQPALEYAHKSGFKIGYWGAFNTTGTYNEIDLYTGYDIAGFSILFTDYFVPVSGVPSLKPERYFNYDNNTTGHLFEGSVSWGGTDNFPLTLLAGAFVYGCDKNDDGDQNYSVYTEAAYTIKTKAGDIQPFIGFTPYAGLYGNTLGVVNAGITMGKTISVTDKFEIPVTASLISNPQNGNIHFVLGISF